VGRSVQLQFTLDGFEPLTVSRVVTDDDTWQFELPTPTTTWTLKTEPADAQLVAVGREWMGEVKLTAGHKPLPVRIARPGCEPVTVTLTTNGKATGERAVSLTCRPLEGRLTVQAPRRPAQVKIDGVALPRAASLDDYPLPVGTWNISLVTPRGRRDARTVEVRAGETTTFLSVVK
jgi:hypothetical protein